MDIIQLVHFRTVAKYENITQASVELYMTQSALSKSIRQLEAELRTDLFDRHGKTITLNAAGKIVLKYADHIIEMVNLMNLALNKEFLAKDNRINLATNRPLIAHNLFPQISIDHPEFSINTKLIHMDGEIASRFLESGVYDLLITDFPVAGGKIVSKLHSEERLCLCVVKDSPLAARTIIQKEDFKDLVLPATQYSYDTVLKPLLIELAKNGISFQVKMVPDIATVNYLMKISDVPSVFTDVAWSFNRQPNRALVEIEGIPHRENYISYLGKNEAEISPLVDILMTQYKDFSEEHDGALEF